MGEPHFDNIVIGATGKALLSLHIQGKEGHASTPEKGINAIDCMARFLTAVQALLDRFALPDNFQPVIAVAFGYEQADPISRRKSLVSYKCNKASKEEDYNAMH